MTKARSTSLSRGLALLEAVSLADRPIRFSKLRAVLPGTPDSTLSRLLKALEASGHLAHLAEGGYAPGPETHRWLTAIRNAQRSFQDVAAQVVQLLTGATRESAAVAVLDEDVVRIIKSTTIPEAVSIIGEGEAVHFENDHAAALAILHQLTASRRAKALKSPYSRIRHATEYAAGVKAASREKGLWLDRSRVRPGICRMALAFTHGGQIGAVFLCLTLESARLRKTALLHALRAAQGILQEQCRPE